MSVAPPECAAASAAPGGAGGRVRGVTVRRAFWWPLPRYAHRRHWPWREQLLLRPRMQRHLQSVQQRPHPRRVVQLWRKGQVGGEPRCHGG